MDRKALVKASRKIKPNSIIKVDATWLERPNNDFLVEVVELGGAFSKFFTRLTGIIQGDCHDNTPAVYTLWRDGQETLHPAA